jgi:hypothetical protein
VNRRTGARSGGCGKKQASKLSPGPGFIRASLVRSGLETEKGKSHRPFRQPYQTLPEQDPELYSIWNKPGF